MDVLVRILFSFQGAAVSSCRQRTLETIRRPKGCPPGRLNLGEMFTFDAAKGSHATEHGVVRDEVRFGMPAVTSGF